MTVKERILKEIEGLPNPALESVFEFAHSISKDRDLKAKIHSFDLGKEFDNINFRKEAYD